MTKHRILLVNIVFNSFSWEKAQINPKAGHTYARTHPPHESLNFCFSKQNIDTDNTMCGYFRHKNTIRCFQEGGLIIFYTKNTDRNNKGEIVGVYGKVKLIEDIAYPNKDFDQGKYVVNLMADKEYSLRFPVPLDANKYKSERNKRLVPQANFKYKTIDFAREILKDEIAKLLEKGNLGEEYRKLVKIYEYYIGEKYLDRDEAEQYELSSIFREENKSNNELEQDILNASIQNNGGEQEELEDIKGKRYKRNNVIIVKIKLLRGSKCQLCGTSIIKKNGEPYIEAAHIKPKVDRGPETLDNILILCPNHHKEFDLGDLKILCQNEYEIKFRLNGKEYQVQLRTRIR